MASFHLQNAAFGQAGLLRSLGMTIIQASKSPKRDEQMNLLPIEILFVPDGVAA